jgi:hypothetical protein
VNWGEFETAAPELARLGRERFEATHVALLGTIRKDGSPRISPVEPYFVRDHLLLGVLGGSHKAGDLQRDPRCAVHSSVADVNGSEGEFKIDGRAVPVTDTVLLQADDRAWWNAVDATDARVFSVDVRTAAHIAWNTRQGTMRVTRWSASTGTEKLTQRY